MFTREIITDTVQLTVSRMTGMDSLDSIAVVNLLNTGALQLQLQRDLEIAISKYLLIENASNRLAAAFAAFSKLPQRNISTLLDLLSTEFDSHIQQKFKHPANSQWIFFAFLVVILMLPFIANQMSHQSFIENAKL